MPLKSPVPDLIRAPVLQGNMRGAALHLVAFTFDYCVLAMLCESCLQAMVLRFCFSFFTTTILTHPRAAPCNFFNSIQEEIDLTRKPSLKTMMGYKSHLQSPKRNPELHQVLVWISGMNVLQRSCLTFTFHGFFLLLQLDAATGSNCFSVEINIDIPCKSLVLLR